MSGDNDTTSEDLSIAGPVTINNRNMLTIFPNDADLPSDGGHVYDYNYSIRLYTEMTLLEGSE